MTGTEDLVAKLGRVLQDLLDRTDASRVTLRVDVPEHGFHVDKAAVEALAPGERSLLQESSVDQRTADTVKWLIEQRRILVQNDVFSHGPAPPSALMKIYGTRAQMLGPLFVGEWLAGWISVHQNHSPRTWRPSDQEALETAMEQVHAMLTALGPARRRDGPSAADS